MPRALLTLFYCFVFSLSTAPAIAQGEVPVNMYTGQPSIGIPITTITSHDVSVPVALTYDINSASNKNPYGYGWNLSAGGSISREVRSLPDDFGFNDSRKGWFYSTGSTGVGMNVYNFNPQSDTLASTSSDETVSPADNEILHSYGYQYDTEPDIFHYSFGDFSGSFVFGNDLAIRTVPYRDLLIEPTYASATDKKIISFTITSSDGYKYTFQDAGESKRRAVKNQFLDNVQFLATDYELYKSNAYNTYVTYNSEWNLTRIDSPNGAYVTFTYQPGEEASSNDVNIGFYKELDPIVANSTDIEVRNIYRVDQTVPKRHLTSITGSTGEKVVFTYDGNLHRITLSDLRKGATTAAQFVRRFDLGYLKVDYQVNQNYLAYSKSFLTTLTESSGCDRMPPIKLSYRGILGPTQNAVTLRDAWGFESGHSDKSHSMPKLYIYPDEPEKHRYRLSPIPGYSGTEIILDGVERRATGMQSIGSLATITYPHGSVTTFEFGPNKYLDTRTNQEELAGGLRIEKISYFDGFNAEPVTKIFEYTNPATGKSSGRILRKPVLAMPAYKWKSPYNLNSTNIVHEKNYSQLSATDRWKYLTMRTESDIAPSERTKGNTVGYSFVKVMRPGAGYATFAYHTPSTYGEAGGDLITINRFARPDISPFPDMGIVSTGGPWRFPHTPNSNLDHERGLIFRKSDYSETGKLVRKTETSYQYIYGSGTTPTKVYGLRYDKFALAEDGNPNRRIFFFGKYALLTDVDKVPWIETTTTYDANEAGATKFATTSTEYIYGSANHKQLTEVKHTSGDGTILRTKFTYPKDYPNVTGTAENAVAMIGFLKNNFRHGAPIETITTRQKASDYERVVGASIVRFDPFNLSRPLVESAWALSTRTPIRIDSFKVSAIELDNGTHRLCMDARYEKRSAISAYTALGQPVTSTDVVGRKTGSTLYSTTTTLPVVQISNAVAGMAGFADFESTTGIEFTSGTAYYGTGRSGDKAFYPGVMLSRILTKAMVDHYILSFWIKSNAALDFTITLKHESGSPQYSTLTWNVPSSGGADFKYVQKRIPVTSVPSGNFRIEIQAASLTVPPAGGSSAALIPVIDDVFFFPENANITSFDYQIPFGPSTFTSGTGEAGHTVYDNLGRMKYVTDRDRNIIKRNQYNLLSTPDPLVAEFSPPSVVYVDESVTFNATPNDCVQNVMYSWDWGTGFETGTATQSHIFAETGLVTVTLKVSHVQYGDRTVSKTFTVLPTPVTLTICAKGVMEYNSTTSSVVSSYSCAGISATPPSAGAIFKVESTTGCSGNCVFVWRFREEGAPSSVIVGYGDQYTYQKVVPGQKSFQIFCEAVTEEGQSLATSFPMDVIVND